LSARTSHEHAIIEELDQIVREAPPTDGPFGEGFLVMRNRIGLSVRAFGRGEATFVDVVDVATRCARHAEELAGIDDQRTKGYVSCGMLIGNAIHRHPLETSA